jgi:hypothetical protein
MKKLQDAGIDNVFSLKKSCRKIHTIFFAVQRQQRKSDVMTYFGLTACSAVYYHAGSSLRFYLIFFYFNQIRPKIKKRIKKRIIHHNCVFQGARKVSALLKCSRVCESIKLKAPDKEHG